MKHNNIYLFGYSGHAYVIIDTLNALNRYVKGYFDLNKAEKDPYNIEFMGFEKNIDLAKLIGDDLPFPSVGENGLRKKLVGLFETAALQQTVIKDPSAIISPNSQIGYSTFIGRGAVLNSLVQIGKGCIINTGAIVEHECSVGDFSHIGPNATLTGNVVVGSEVFIGAGAVVIPAIKIGNGATVGAGAVVVKDIPAHEVWAGNPAKFLKHA